MESQDCEFPVCFTGFCDGIGVCNLLALTDTTPCDDNDACTVEDQCFSGVCGGSPRECEDFEECTVDSCNSASGCVHTLIPNCGVNAPQPPQETPAPSSSPQPDPAPPNVDLLSASSTPQPDIYANAIARPTVLVVAPEEDNDVGAAPGKSENQVVAESSFSFGGAFVGLILVSCAGCCAMFFGIFAARDIEKDEDRLELVLDAEQDIMSTPVENDAFAAPLNPV